MWHWAQPSRGMTMVLWSRLLARLFPIKHKDALGPVLTHQALGHRQGLEICRKSDLSGARNFAFGFVCDFQAALVHAAARICSAFIPPVRIEVRIIVPV